MTKNIILTGFMGAGKSLISRHLADMLGREVVSTDDLIEEREERTINDIFERSGEAYFRELEAAVVRDIAQKENLIIDCGGGIVLNPENIERFKTGSGIRCIDPC